MLPRSHVSNTAVNWAKTHGIMQSLRVKATRTLFGPEPSFIINSNWRDCKFTAIGNARCAQPAQQHCQAPMWPLWCSSAHALWHPAEREPLQDSSLLKACTLPIISVIKMTCEAFLNPWSRHPPPPQVKKSKSKSEWDDLIPTRTQQIHVKLPCSYPQQRQQKVPERKGILDFWEEKKCRINHIIDAIFVRGSVWPKGSSAEGRDGLQVMHKCKGWHVTRKRTGCHKESQEAKIDTRLILGRKTNKGKKNT